MIVYEGERGTFGATAASSTIVVSVASDTTVGNLLIANIGADGALTISSIVDSRANTWQTDVILASGTSFTRAILSARMATPLLTGDSLTITLSAGRSNRIGALEEFSGIVSSSWLDQTASADAASGTALDSGLTATTAQADELVVGCLGQGATDAAFTKGAGFLDFTTSEFFHGQNLFQEYKIVSAVDTYKADATSGTSQRWSALCATYKAAAVATAGSGMMLLRSS